MDEGELSSCSDFGLQIREALKNSGWLIVICSSETKDSPWVNLEIKTFLEFHDRSRILAVVTEENRKMFSKRNCWAVTGPQRSLRPMQEGKHRNRCSEM